MHHEMNEFKEKVNKRPLSFKPPTPPPYYSSLHCINQSRL